MPDDEKPKRRPRASSGGSSRRPQGKRGPVEISEQDRSDARAQIGKVVPIKGHAGRRSGDPRQSPGHPVQVRIQQRRAAATTLRRMGFTYAEIAAELHKRTREHPNEYSVPPSYDAKSAHADVSALLDKVTIEAAHDMREQDLAILLSMQRTVYVQAIRGDHRAIASMIGILDRRAKYLGLDAPVRLELSGVDGGAIEIDASNPSSVMKAALDALGDLLPNPEPPQLAGGTS